MADRPKTLSDLGLTARAGRDPQLLGLTLDSRAVRPGFLFAAMPGSHVHGAAYIAKALELGAVAILTDATGAALAADALAGAPAALVVAADPREALARAAALWFGAQPATMVAVTGTNGKTSVATFARQIWMAKRGADIRHYTDSLAIFFLCSGLTLSPRRTAIISS